MSTPQIRQGPKKDSQITNVSGTGLKKDTKGAQISQLVDLVGKQQIQQKNEESNQQNGKILEIVTQLQKDVSDLQNKVQEIENEQNKLKQENIQLQENYRISQENVKLSEEKLINLQYDFQQLNQFFQLSVQNSEKGTENFEQQQNLINQVVNDSKKLQENNQSFKDQIIQKINLFHDALNQNLVAATEDMKKQLNNIGLQVQQQQAQFMASSQSFSQWLTQLQTSVNTPSQNQQIPVQQPLYHTQQVPYDNYQQQPNYGHQNDYSQQSQILQSQQYVQPQQQIQQPPPTSTLSEVTRSKIKIVSQNNVPVQYGQ